MARSAASIVGLVALALGGSCDSGSMPRGNELVVLLPDGAQTLDPRFATDAWSVKITRLLHAGLVHIDADTLEAVPDLAESIQQPATGVYRVRLLAGLRFSDGTPLEAEDVASTYRSLGAAEIGSPYRRTYVRIREIRVLDDRTIQFDLGGAHAPFLTDMEVPVLPRRYEHRRTGEPGAPLVGSGPYALVRFRRDEIVLEPNSHGHRRPVASHRVVLRTVHDDVSRALRLLGEGGDVAQNAVPHHLVAIFARNPAFRVLERTGCGFTMIGLNLRRGPLAAIAVRRAIAHALDRELLLRTRLDGRGVIASSFLSPLHWAHTSDVRRYEYDSRLARELLDRAGYPDPPGEEPRMRLRFTTTTLRSSVALGRAVAAMLGEIGIEVQVRPLERGTFFDDLKKGRFEMTVLSLPDIVQPHVMHWFFGSDSIPTPERPDAGGNRWGYRSEELDLLIELGRTVERREQRRRLYGAAQARIAEDLPVIPLWHENTVAVVRRRVDGLDVRPDARLDGLAGISLARH